MPQVKGAEKDIYKKNYRRKWVERWDLVDGFGGNKKRG